MTIKDTVVMIHFRPNNQFDPRRKSPMTSCGKYIYYDVQKWSEDLREVTCAECKNAIREEGLS
jgi:hypothetical protein